MRNYTITSVWGIPIRINVSLLVFLPILVWLIGSGGQIDIYAGILAGLTGVTFDLSVLQRGTTPLLIGVLAAIGLFASVTIHELGHSWVALRYGLHIESITLWILGGIAALSEVPREWNREFWIAIAGPITSVLVAIGSLAVMLVIPNSLPVIKFVFGWLGIVNVTLAAFNLLPAFPMDGGRVLRAILARNRPYASATRIAGRIGVIFAILFAVVGVIGFNVILILLALFIYGAATTESRTVLIDELLEGITVGDIMTRDPGSIESSTTVAELVNRMIRERATVFPVTAASGETVGLVALPDLRGLDQQERAETQVADVMRDVSRIPETADAFDTLGLLGRSGGMFALVEEDGVITGVLTDADYSHALTIRRGFQSSLST